MGAERAGYRGYVTPRTFGGFSIPVPVQNLVLRDYCERKGLLFKLPLNENMFPHSYMVLESILRNLAGVQGIVACSYFMLPEQPARRARMYEVLFRADAQFHFAMEEVAIARPADAGAIEEILTIHRTLQLCPKTIPGIEALG